MTELTCDSCGESYREHYVTRQRNDGSEWAGQLLCWQCVNRINEEIRERQRQARASAPKCECCQRRRGTWKVSGVLTCGPCKKTISRNRERQLSGFGSLALVVALQSAPLTRDEILTLAEVTR